MTLHHTKPSKQSISQLFSSDTQGELVMLNLLRFKRIADYANYPDIAPSKPVSGQQAYNLYLEHAEFYLQKHGASIEFLGDALPFFIGPDANEESWDLMMLVKQRSLADFKAFISDKGYLAGIGHREAAIIDSRLMPVTSR